MEVTALCSSLMINVMLLLLIQVHQSYFHNADATFPRVVVSQLQLYEYDSLFVNCEGFLNDLVEWRVMRTINGVTTICNTKWETKGPCSIRNVLLIEEGEYWCEAEGQKSSAVNIRVTAGSVILESPALPVMEGESVTLHCRTKTTPNFTADFYKDGVLVNTSTAKEMTIQSVSKSDEGLYKCKFSGAGESPESWLAVRSNSVILERPAFPVMEGDAVTMCCKNTKTSKLEAVFYKNGRPVASSPEGKMSVRRVSKSDEGLYKCHVSGVGESAESWMAVREHPVTPRPVSHSPHVSTLLWIIVTFLVVVLLLLFMLILHYMNLKGSQYLHEVQTGSSVPPSSIPMISFQQTDSAEYSVYNPNPTTCAVIENPTRAKETNTAEQQSAIYTVITDIKKEKDEKEPLTTPVYYTLSMAPGVSWATTTTSLPSASH